MMSPLEIKEFKEKLEEMGEKKVKENIAIGIYNEKKKKIAMKWLEEKERENSDQQFQQQLHTQQETRNKVMKAHKHESFWMKIGVITTIIACIIALITGVIALLAYLK